MAITSTVLGIFSDTKHKRTYVLSVLYRACTHLHYYQLYLLVKCCASLFFKVTPHLIGISHHLNIEQSFISPSGNARLSTRTTSIVTGFVL